MSDNHGQAAPDKLSPFKEVQARVDKAASFAASIRSKVITLADRIFEAEPPALTGSGVSAEKPNSGGEIRMTSERLDGLDAALNRLDQAVNRLTSGL